MRKLYGALILLVLSIPLIARQNNVNLVNLATDVFGILPANNLPVFGVPVDNVTGTTYTVACGTSLANSDNLHWKLFSNSGAIAVTLFKQSTCTYAPNFTLQGSTTSGSGTVTITPTTSQISKNGGAYGSSATIAPGQSFRMVADISSSGCSTNGCWDLTTLNGTGSVASVIIAGTANQIAVSGTCTITSSGTCTLAFPSTIVIPSGSTATTQSAADASTKVATTAYADTSSTNATAGTAICNPGSYAAQTDASTVTWAIASAKCASASLLFTVHGGSRTLALTGLVNGGTYVLKITQDGTGGEGLTLGSGCTWKVSGGGSGAITPSTGANAIDVLSWQYDGTNCLGNFNKNFN